MTILLDSKRRPKNSVIPSAARDPCSSGAGYGLPHRLPIQRPRPRFEGGDHLLDRFGEQQAYGVLKQGRAKLELEFELNHRPLGAWMENPLRPQPPERSLGAGRVG